MQVTVYSLDTLQDGARFGFDDRLHHRFSLAFHHRNRNRFFVNIHADIYLMFIRVLLSVEFCFTLKTYLKGAPFYNASASRRSLEHGSVLWLISDLDDIGETLGRSKLQSYGLALAEDRLAVAEQEGIDRENDHVEQALLQQRLAEETVA
jgi:hypothetical protein